MKKSAIRVLALNALFDEIRSKKLWGLPISNELRSATLFTGLTRPQMFAGVTYTFFIINVVITVELFLIFRSWWILLVALVLHGFGALLCLREPRFFDLWITRVRNCPRVKNYNLWRCNSYRP